MDEKPRAAPPKKGHKKGKDKYKEDDSDSDSDLEWSEEEASQTMPGRHSENKKELLMMIEETVAKMKADRAAADKVMKELMELEFKTEADKDYLVKMQGFLEPPLPDTIGQAAWEKFYEKYACGIDVGIDEEMPTNQDELMIVDPAVHELD